MLVKLNHNNARTWSGLVNELFADFDQNLPKTFGYSAAVAVNIVETDDAFHMELAAPGRNKDLFSLKVENNQLTVGYNNPEKVETTGYKSVRREFTIENFSRRFNLSELVNTEAIAAKYEDGLLKVLLPKKAEVKPPVQQISVR
jgi:HSP20 family protein